VNNPDSYENVMKEMEEVNDELESEDLSESKDFKFEYAFESLTNKNSSYKRRNYDV
jgi:hypothetical protein